MNSFKDLGVNPVLVQGLNKMNITKPTPIQASTITPITANKDVIGEAVTGSGKTLAYLLPSLQRIDVTSKELDTIVLAPTHELVIQINNVIKEVAHESQLPIRSLPIIGNVNIKRQVDKLKTKPHIIVGTSGRILELIKMKKIKAHQVKTIVIDEADKLLSDNYLKDVKAVIKTTQRDRQLLAYSASISDKTILIAKELMKEPLVIRQGIEKVNSNIEHYFIKSTERDKIKTLRSLIHAIKPSKAILFLNKNERIQDYVSKLNYHKIKSVGIFGNARKNSRKEALDAFRSGKANTLVASDLVARGLDLSHITHVINLDIPDSYDEYLHRVGRTGRAGQTGVAISIVTERELLILKKIAKRQDIKVHSTHLAKGKLIVE